MPHDDKFPLLRAYLWSKKVGTRSANAQGWYWRCVHSGPGPIAQRINVRYSARLDVVIVNFRETHMDYEAHPFDINYKAYQASEESQAIAYLRSIL